MTESQRLLPRNCSGTQTRSRPARLPGFTQHDSNIAKLAAQQAWKRGVRIEGGKEGKRIDEGKEGKKMEGGQRRQTRQDRIRQRVHPNNSWDSQIA